MKKRYVITNVRHRAPFTSTILYAFMLDYYEASGIWWGVFITIYSIYWVAIIISYVWEKGIDLNYLPDVLAEKLKSGGVETKKSTFQERLEEKQRSNSKPESTNSTIRI